MVGAEEKNRSKRTRGSADGERLNSGLRLASLSSYWVAQSEPLISQRCRAKTTKLFFRASSSASRRVESGGGERVGWTT